MRPKTGRKYLLDHNLLVHVCDTDNINQLAQVGIPDDNNMIWDREWVDYERLTNSTVWCVKYALTSGIYELKGEINPDEYFCEDSGNRSGHFLSKNEYRLTLEDAKIAAEELRKRKIKSLEKQLANVMTKKIQIKRAD